jgi:hypothetical protein
MDDVERTRKFNIAARRFQTEAEECGIGAYHFPYGLTDIEQVYKMTIACIRTLSDHVESTPYEMGQLILLEIEQGMEQNGVDLYHRQNADAPVYEPGPSHYKLKYENNSPNTDLVANVLHEPIPKRVTESHPHAHHFYDQ